MSEQPTTNTYRIVFVILHALATFFHHPWHGYARAFDLHAAEAMVNGVAAVVALAFPLSDLALAFLLVTSLIDVAWYLPAVPNHWMLTGLVDLFLLAGMAAGRGGTDWMARIRLPFTVGVAVFYFYTGFWKLTAEFFDPAVSCGVRSWRRLADQILILPSDGVGPFLATYVVVAIELVFPFLLVWRRTRALTAFLFAGFHAILGLDIAQNYMNFSTVMWALLAFTLGEEAWERLGVPEASLRAIGRAWAVAIPVLWVILFAGPSVFYYQAPRWGLWVLFAPFVLYGFAKAVSAIPLPKVATPTWAWVFVAAITLNGAMPILGLKTRNSWQMYANLRLEADYSNHFLLPRSLDVAGLLADKVRVLEVSDPELQKLWIAPGRQLTWYMFRTDAARHPEASVRYVRNGEEVLVERIGDDPVLSRPYPPIVRHYVWFRPLEESVATTCLW